MNAGAALADQRWRKPENVQKRVDALAARLQEFVDSAPPLTPQQAERLASILTGAVDEGAGQ